LAHEDATTLTGISPRGHQQACQATPYPTFLASATHATPIFTNSELYNPNQDKTVNKVDWQAMEPVKR